MHDQMRGECVYQAEIDHHFPQLTVGQTLEFAARATVCTYCHNVGSSLVNDFIDATPSFTWCYPRREYLLLCAL